MFSLVASLSSEIAQVGEFNTMTLIWACVILLAVIVEIFTVSLVSIWFIPGATISLIISFIPKVHPAIQITVFVVITVVFFVFLRKRFTGKLGRSKSATNADTVIGGTALVTEDFDNLAGKGAVKIYGKEWSARADDVNEIIKIGDKVTVLRIEGVKLICTKK